MSTEQACGESTLTLPVAAVEMWDAPQLAFTPWAMAAYLCAGVIPGLFAYAGFAHLAARFGAVRASISVYIAPVASALLSWVMLSEPPSVLHVVGGLLILGGVWLSLKK